MYSGDTHGNILVWCLNSCWLQGWESADTAEWQSFDLSQHLDADQYLTEIDIVIRGTGSGEPGFKMLDLRVLGTAIDNPTDTVYVSQPTTAHGVVLHAQHSRTAVEEGRAILRATGRGLAPLLVKNNHPAKTCTAVVLDESLETNDTETNNICASLACFAPPPLVVRSVWYDNNASGKAKIVWIFCEGHSRYCRRCTSRGRTLGRCSCRSSREVKHRPSYFLTRPVFPFDETFNNDAGGLHFHRALDPANG